MSNAPFSVLKYLHNNFCSFYSNNDNKYEIIDANRVPYIAKYNKVIENFLSVADENGCIKFFKTYPKLTLVKELAAQKSCIYDLEWLSSNQLACGGGDQFVSVYDTSTYQRIAVLRGHTESVKSISSIPLNPYVLASGSRDGSVLIFDIRCNKYQATIEIINELNIEADSCCIRAVNTLHKAHFTENLTSHNTSSRLILKTKTPNINSLNSPLSPSTRHHHNSQNVSHHHLHNLNSSLKKSTPVSCVLYQNDHLLVSAGVTDGLIKVWDTRKIYTNTSKKTFDPIPVHVFDNQLKSSNSFSTPSSNQSKKGYSNLTFNSARSHLYSNCMNNFMYETNLVTCNQNHTRILNQPLNNKLIKNYHLNQSNFIKASISQCDNFIVTGSSDFNAYIYSTNLNNNLACFKRFMPVIVLKGHTNEVTTVDWNPFDSNQLVTCSDDNSIRLWNIKRELESLESKECNFLKAETIDEFKKDINQNTSALSDGDDIDNDLVERMNENYVSSIQFNNKIYNKYRPHSTGIYDDYLFVGYEYKNFMRKPKTIRNNINFDEMDIEKELCIKCENINIDQVSTKQSNASSSPTSSMLISIEKDLDDNQENAETFKEKKFKKLKSFLSDLPINILPEQEEDKDTQTRCLENKIELKQEVNLSNKLLTTVFTSLTQSQSQNKPKTKTVRHRIVKSKRSPDNNLDLDGSIHSSKMLNLSKTPVTSKKRNINLCQKDETESNDDPNDPNQLDQFKVQRTKKRLIMSECLLTQSTLTSNQNKATTSVNSGSRSILDYFSVKSQGSR